MRTDRFALADLGQQDRLDEIVTDAARGLEDTFDVNERSNRGCKPESPKILSEKVAGEVSGC